MLAKRGRAGRGLGSGETVAIDDVMLFSKRHQLVGRPDRIVRVGRIVIPEGWKPSRWARPWHEARLGAYFILIEEAHGVRPPYGVLVMGDGKRVLAVAACIHEARRRLAAEIPVSPPDWQCRTCGRRSRCRQARG